MELDNPNDFFGAAYRFTIPLQILYVGTIWNHASVRDQVHQQAASRDKSHGRSPQIAPFIGWYCRDYIRLTSFLSGWKYRGLKKAAVEHLLINHHVFCGLFSFYALLRFMLRSYSNNWMSLISSAASFRSELMDLAMITPLTGAPSAISLRTHDL